MPKCAFIDNGVAIHPNGTVTPCCHIKPKKDSAVHISNLDWQNSFPALREKMKNGWAEECRSCKLDEEANGNSARMRYEKFTIPSNTKTIFDLKIANTCNLSCRMCTPRQSSTWDKIVKSNPDVDWNSFDVRLYPVKKGDSWHANYLEGIKDKLIEAKRIKFTGGEPFLVKHVKLVCKQVLDAGAIKANIKFITNGQVDLDNEWYDIINCFDDVNIDVSVDGIGSRYEYIRPGSKWNKIDEFINKIKHNCPRVEIGATFVPQTLNAAVFYDTQDWASSMGINIYNDADWQLTDPEFMNYSSLKPSLREKLNIKTSIPYVEENFTRLVDFMRTLDKIHGTDMKKECPELFDE